MAGWIDEMYESIAEYVRSVNSRLDVAEVIGFEQETRSGGYCETCAYDETVIEISYLDSKGKVNEFTYYGTMGEFMRNIT